tara:strand:+ start:346 stop:486 length:141 start_codon:yes stop_codon:yes gene_type:complete
MIYLVGFWSVFGWFLVGFFGKINRKMVGLVCISNTTNHQPTKITVL